MYCISIEPQQKQMMDMLYASGNAAQSRKTATDWNAPKDDNTSKKFHHRWYHSVDKKHSFFLVKFEAGLLISFGRKSMSFVQTHFSKRGLNKTHQHFFLKLQRLLVFSTRRK
jgi:hypothetical protein